MINKNKGFTLVELLISIAIIITSATVVVAIITSSFRGSSKTLINEEVRQSGNTTLAQVGKMIQFADSFDGVEDLSGEVQNNCINSSGEDVDYKAILFESDKIPHRLACTDEGLILDNLPMIDEGRLTVENCSLTCSQTSATDTPTIGITFSLSRYISDLPEQSTNFSEFSKKFKMRNLNQ